jgi:hypothetical protein
VLFFIIFFIEGYILKLKGSVYFYSIWGLTLFSRSFCNKVQKCLSWFVNRTTFRYNLNSLSSRLIIFSPLSRRIFRINFVFRVVISVPLLLTFSFYW